MKNFKRILIGSLLVLASLGLAGCASTATGGTVDQTATVKTARGDFTISLDKGAAPNTVANFIKKSTDGEYAGRTFHRVEDWVTQGGDPLGTGTGGGDQPTELSDRNFSVGAVGIARAGDIKVSNADQFFICKTDCTFLNNQYTYFGKVTTGMDIVNKIQIGDKISSIEIK